MFESVRVVWLGRVGTAVNERLRERQISAAGDGADLVLLCVPDSAIRESAAAVSPGPWIALVRGAIARGHLATVQAHLTGISGRAPQLEEMSRVLATVTAG